MKRRRKEREREKEERNKREKKKREEGRRRERKTEREINSQIILDREDDEKDFFEVDEEDVD